jgi:hypothetical protein
MDVVDVGSITEPVKSVNCNAVRICIATFLSNVSFYQTTLVSPSL